MIVLKISSNHSNVLSIPGAQTLGRQCDSALQPPRDILYTVGGTIID